MNGRLINEGDAMGIFASERQSPLRKRANSELHARQGERCAAPPRRRSASASRLAASAAGQPQPLRRLPASLALAQMGSPSATAASAGNAALRAGPDIRWRVTKAIAVAADLLQAQISVIATIPGGGRLVNLANYAAGPALALSAVPAELADLMEDRERWEASDWRQIASQPARNIGALGYVVGRSRPTRAAEQMGSAPHAGGRLALTEIDEFGDGISSLGNLLNVASGLATLGATAWPSGENPLYLNVAGAALSAVASIPDLWDAVRHDPSRSRVRTTLLGVSFALNCVSAVAGGLSAQLWSDEDDTASIALGLLSSVLGLAGSMISETAELIDREGMRTDDRNRLYVEVMHRLWSMLAQARALPSHARSSPGATFSLEGRQPALGGWARWSRHGAALISAWDEMFNASLAP
jgi:hypothetical protein